MPPLRGLRVWVAAAFYKYAAPAALEGFGSGVPQSRSSVAFLVDSAGGMGQADGMLRNSDGGVTEMRAAGGEVANIRHTAAL
jgi:hypothetical protein